MRQNHNFLKDVAHEKFTTGLVDSGIRIESIPNVEEMNECMSPFGWGVVNIDGFIPAIAFFSFQSQGILPVASEIRSLKHILYTPAPDIIHEAAGHAPILCDEKYSEFVKLFGTIGSKAIATKEEHEVFEAARALSNMLELGSASDEEVEAAKKTLEEKTKQVVAVSEAEQIARFYWWTVEFGMIGDVNNPRIYGAGLLSSIGESANSLTDKVKKLPFDLETVINTGFDITVQQPQLFVCESFEQLIDAVHEFSERMAYKRGGTESLDKAIHSGSTATMVYSSGLQVSGTLTDIEKDATGEAFYLKTTGPTTLAFDHAELEGHGKDRHFHGFGSPIGKLQNEAKPIEDFSDEDLQRHGIEIGKKTKLSFESGVQLVGETASILKRNGKIVIITFTDVTVSYGERALFQPEWGEYDMAVGESIISVFGGAADPEKFYNSEEDVQPELKSLPKREYSKLEALYGSVREMREKDVFGKDEEERIQQAFHDLEQEFTNDWLLRLEIYELLQHHQSLPDIQNKLLQDLNDLKGKSEEWNSLINNGLRLVAG